MLKIERTDDMQLIWELMTHPDIWPNFAHDGFEPDDFCPNENAYNLIARDGNNVVGFFIGYPVTNTQIIAHVGITKQARGIKAVMLGQMAIEWVWQNTPYVRIVGSVVSTNLLARRYDAKIGLTPYGYNQAAVRINGVLHDAILLGITKG